MARPEVRAEFEQYVKPGVPRVSISRTSPSSLLDNKTSNTISSDVRAQTNYSLLGGVSGHQQGVTIDGAGGLERLH
jgi:hypothetical protein